MVNMASPQTGMHWPLTTRRRKMIWELVRARCDVRLFELPKGHPRSHRVWGYCGWFGKVGLLDIVPFPDDTSTNYIACLTPYAFELFPQHEKTRNRPPGQNKKSLKKYRWWEVVESTRRTVPRKRRK